MTKYKRHIANEPRRHIPTKMLPPLPPMNSDASLLHSKYLEILPIEKDMIVQ
ncbi:hypothetical protein ACHAXH_006892 [Discostella pseudostelligera]